MGRALRLLALAVLACSLSSGCRTPWSVEPLPVDVLETGMRPEAVRYVLGEPERVDHVHAAAPPANWPRLPASSDIHPTQAWHYEDEKVDPLGLTFAGLALPLSIPVHLLAVAFRLDESERDCMWLEQRELDLYFEDERLAEWVVTVKPEPDWCQGDPNWQPSPSIFEPPFPPPWPNGRRRGGC